MASLISSARDPNSGRLWPVCYIPPGKLSVCLDDLQMHNSVLMGGPPPSGIYTATLWVGFHGPDAERLDDYPQGSAQTRYPATGTARAELVMPGNFEAAEMLRLDAFDEQFGQSRSVFSADNDA
jgi:hypothetical protein